MSVNCVKCKVAIYAFDVFTMLCKALSITSYFIPHTAYSIKIKTADQINNRRFHILVFKMLSILFAQSISMLMGIFPLSHQYLNQQYRYTHLYIKCLMQPNFVSLHQIQQDNTLPQLDY